jgi:hypothetical protein
MKMKWIYVAGLIFIAMSFARCEKGCKICQQNTYNSSGTLIATGTEAEYCDASLTRIEITPDVSSGGQTLKWVCR